VVSQLGVGVERPAAGTRVALDPTWGCGQCEYCREGLVPRCLDGRMLGERQHGGLAEYVVCPARQAIPLPQSLGFDEAACLPITFGTAWRMVVTRARVLPGETVVVLGAGGGVAIAAIQIAKLLGARVIATASSDDKLRSARALGADEAINYASEPEWDVVVRRLTGKRGADVIVETVGASTWERSIRALGKGGRLVTSGATSGPIGATDIRYLFRREQTILGSNGWLHLDIELAVRLAGEGRLRAVIDRLLPLERTAEGERALEERKVFGKVIIKPGLTDAA
jgi:NADPH:quinone reductase-like Zn-dependent oxidoreductase